MWKHFLLALPVTRASNPHTNLSSRDQRSKIKDPECTPLIFDLNSLKLKEEWSILKERERERQRETERQRERERSGQ